MKTTEPNSNPLVKITVTFKDGSSLAWRLPEISQRDAMPALGTFLGRLCPNGPVFSDMEIGIDDGGKESRES